MIETPSVLAAVEAELERLGTATYRSGTAAAALAVAACIDATTSARDTAALVRELRAALADLRAEAGEQPVPDALDGLLARRAARLASGAAG